MYDFVFGDNEKAFTDYMSFADDVVQTSELLSLFIINNTNNKLLTFEFLKDTKFSSLHESSKKSMTKFSQVVTKAGISKVVAGVSIITIVLTAAYESPKLLENEDYDALTVTLFSAGVGIALALALSLSVAVFIIASAILAIIFAIVIDLVIDSDLTVYLRKSLLYRNEDYNLRFINELAEQSKKSELQKKFDTPNDLIKFIGSNYQTNKKFFDTALANELSFFRTELSGIKLSLEDVEYFKGHRKVYISVKNVSEKVEVSMHYYKVIKIPNFLAEDEEFKLLFKMQHCKDLEFKFKDLEKSNNKYIFNIFKQGNTLAQQNNINFYDNIKIDTYKVYLIVLSSKINLKYEFELIDKDKTSPNIYVSYKNFKQISFSEDDQEILNKEENKNDEN